MAFKFLDLGEAIRIGRMLCHDAIMSPLRRYVFYSVVFHAVLIGALSVHLLLPKKPPAPPPDKNAPAAKAAEKAPAKGTEAAKGAEKAPAKDSAPAKDTGTKEDYYKRANIDTTPAKPEEIPKNPFDTKGKDDLK